MSSILKVDQLQDSGGNAIITSDGSGNLTAGTIPAKTIGTGALVQYVRGTSSTEFVQASPTNNTLYFPSSNKLTATITPTSTSNKILVQYISTIQPTIGVAGDLGMGMVVKESISGGATTNIIPQTNSFNSGIYQQSVGASYNIRIRLSEILERSPSTTSAVTYEVGIFGYDATEIKLNMGGSRGEIILMEIAA